MTDASNLDSISAPRNKQLGLLVLGVALIVLGIAAPIAVYYNGITGRLFDFGNLSFSIIWAGFAAIGVGITVFIVRSRFIRGFGMNRRTVLYLIIALVMTAFASGFVSIVSLWVELLIVF